MFAEQFYTTHNDTSIPLYLMSQSQWAEGMEVLSTEEKNCLLARQFEGRLGQFAVIHHVNGQISKAYIGTGNGNQELALAHAALALPAYSYQVQDLLSHNAALAWSLAQYHFDAYKKSTVLPRLLIVNEEDLNDILPLAKAIFVVRDLVNAPTNEMGPKDLALVLERLAQAHGGQLQQWIGEELVHDNFPAIHAVGRASASSPRLLSLTWGNERNPKVTLVGKGVCFDTGGLDIKPAVGMRLMKKDMGGAAQAIGLAQWIMTRELPIRLQVLIPAVENSIGPDAFRPGDVITMRNGLTVEIENTDAEGRLILADTLVKAYEEPPELLFSFATLTGAARVALGSEVPAFFTPHDGLAADIASASTKTADPVWRMPLAPAYEDYLHSSIADLSNSSSSPYAGAIIAALFLQRFVPKAKWAFFDLMAWNITAKPGKPEGGEAMGLRTVAEYLLRVYG